MQVGAVRTKDRIAALDALRGVALIGVLIAHMPAFSEDSFMNDPLIGRVDWGADDIAWWFNRLFIDGAARAIFSMLFGAGLILFMEKAPSGRAPWDLTHSRMLRRLGLLFLFGVVNSTLLLFPGDILLIYAATGLIALLALRWPVRRLILGAAVVTLVTMAGDAMMQRETLALRADAPRLEAAPAGSLSAGDTERLKEWRELKAPPRTDPEYRQSHAEAQLGGYPALLAFAARDAAEANLAWDETLLWVLDAFAMMLLGMALYRAGWLQGMASRRHNVLLAAVGLSTGLAFRIWFASFTWDRIDGGWEPTGTGLFAPYLRYAPVRILMALGYVGLFHLVFPHARRLFAPFEAYGRMALTSYLGQSILGAIVFSSFGLGLWANIFAPICT